MPSHPGVSARGAKPHVLCRRAGPHLGAGAGIVALVAALSAAGAPVAAAPAQSTYIADVQIDQSTIKKFADESDNYHLTWHSDDGLYGAYGDGWGFQKTDITKRAIGVSRITGTPPTLTGTDTWEGDAQGGTGNWSTWNGKTWGMLSTGADLHMWFTIGRPRALGFTEARLASSSNNGKSWTKASWAFPNSDKFLMPSFLQIGKGHTAAGLPASVTGYVYSYHTRLVAHPGEVQTPGRIDLFRVPKGQIKDRSAYQFFAGLNASGEPIWSAALADREPVMEKPHALDTPPAVSWNRHLNRYIMVMGHVPAGATSKRGVGFYEATAPWGPWYKIKEIDQFLEGTTFFHQFPTKWMNADLTAWMGFTGTDKVGGQEWDSLDIVKTKFVLADAPTPAPNATADAATTSEDTAVTVAVLANDTGTGLTIPSVTTPGDGTARINTDRTITYTPDPGFAGTDAFNYTIRDGSARTDSAAVTITVRSSPTPVIKIVSAIYGSTKTCDAKAPVAKLCDGKSSCTVAVGNGLCGDPQPWTKKTLSVSFTCGSVSRTAKGLEFTNLALSCAG